MAKRSRQQVLSDPTGPNLKLIDPNNSLVIPQFKVAIGFPCHDKVDALFAHHLAELSAYTAAMFLASGAEFEYGIKTVAGTYIHKARTDLMESALADNVSHLLWLDSDMTFPKDAFIRLHKHGKEIVGCNYSTRGLPPKWVAIKDVEGGKKVETRHDSTGLEECEAIGFGCVLMDLRRLRELLKDLPRPWFGIGDRWGEDVWFCRLIRTAGVKVWVDHDLSKEVRHIGTYEYATTAVQTWREVHGSDT